MGSYTKFSDRELSILLGKGDISAYSEIFRRYKTVIYMFAYKRTEDREEAKDLTQELFLMIWEKHEELVISTELSSFLYRVVKNKILNYYKHKKVSERYIDSFASEAIQYQNSSDELIRHNDLNNLIEAEIAALPKKMRRVFELSRKTYLTRKQIAAELNITEETVKTHMKHALAKLRTRLGSLVFLVLFIHP